MVAAPRGSSALRRLLLLLALLLAPAAASAEAPDLVFVLAGQSNMSGRGDLADLPPDLAQGVPGTFVFSHGAWLPAREPVDLPRGERRPSDDVDAGVGPGLAFAAALQRARPGASIGLIACAKGATAIRQWVPGRALFDDCLAQVQAALGGRPPDGVLWYQGEWDARSLRTAKAWPAAFAALVMAWREHWGPDLPVVFAQLASLGNANRGGFPAWEQLQALQAAMDLPRVVMIAIDDAPLKPDDLHLSTAGAILAGERFAAALVPLLR